jgi:DNA-binding GntR family transcriptional regulator
MTDSAGETVPADGPKASAAPRVPKRSALADEVHEILRESVLKQRFKHGERLNLAQLTREMHVSNTPVRAALARLESEGLVIRVPYRGYTVSPMLDSRGVSECYDFRLLLEPVAAARAPRRQRRGLTGAL